MKQTKQFLRPLLMAIVMLVGMLVPKGAWAQSPVTVGDEGFSNIQDAINYIFENEMNDATLTLHQDFTLEDVERIDISFESGSEYFNITIDLNGHTITGCCEWNTNAIEFYNYGEGLPTVTIANSCQDKKGKLFNCCLHLHENTKVIVNEGVSIYPSSELLESCYFVFSINSETSSVENYGDIYGGVMVGPGGSFINIGSVAYVDGEFENNGGYCAYFNWADDGSSFRAFAYDGVVYDYNEWDEDTSITSEVTKEPTCTEPGVRTFTGTFSCRGQEFTDTKEVEIAIDPNAHDYHVQLDENEKPVFVWSEDYTTATLQLVCSRDAEHTAGVEVTLGEGITSEDTTPATCTTAGVRIYTAKATYEGVEYTGTKEVEISATGHAYHVQLDEDSNPVFVWSEDYTTATLQLVCSRDAEHTANVEVTGEGITSEDTTPATCTTAGVRTYTAKATYKDVEYTGTKEVEISAAGHSFVDGVCEVCHATAVAEVMIGETTTGYTDIQEAFDAAMAATGEVTVKLLADVTLTEFENNLDRGEEANRYDVALTLDLNGHNVTGKNSQADIPVTSITLNITDSSEGMTGSINNCLLLVAKSYIYVDEGVTLRAEEWDLVFLQGDCYLENHGNLYGIVVYNAGTTFINFGSVVRAQYFGGDFENWGSFIPIWYWVYNDVDEVMSSVSVSVNGTIYSSDEGTLEVSSEVTQAPTCTEKGERTYSATVTYEYKDYSDTYTAEIGIDPNAHDFTSKTLTAEPDEHGLYAYVCDHDCGAHGDYNVVKGDSDGNTIELTANTDSETTTYTAEAPVTLTDAGGFASPVPFTAASITYTRPLASGKWGTLCLPYALSAKDGYEYFTLSNVSSEAVTLSKIEGTVAAGTPVLVRHSDSGNLSLTESNVQVGISTNPAGAIEGLQLQGTFVPKPVTSGYYLDATDGLLYSIDDWSADNGALTIPAFRAWFASSTPAGARSLGMIIEADEITSLDALRAALDGTALIYGLDGQLRSELQEGVNIVNGKKVIVK